MRGFRELHVALLLAASSLTDASSFSHALPEVQAEQRRIRKGKRSASGSAKAEPIYKQQAPAAQMIPSIHPHHNKRDPAHLLSRRSASLFYTQNGNIYLQDASSKYTAGQKAYNRLGDTC